MNRFLRSCELVGAVYSTPLRTANDQIEPDRDTPQQFRRPRVGAFYNDGEPEISPHVTT